DVRLRTEFLKSRHTTPGSTQACCFFYSCGYFLRLSASKNNHNYKKFERRRREEWAKKTFEKPRTQENITGKATRLRRELPSFHASCSGWHARRKWGKRRSKVPTAICPSRRARGAPRQKWTPLPKARCSFSWRRIFSTSGSGNCCGSVLAPSKAHLTISPLWIN